MLYRNLSSDFTYIAQTRETATGHCYQDHLKKLCTSIRFKSIIWLELILNPGLIVTGQLTIGD